jgi:hypothetical protein
VAAKVLPDLFLKKFGDFFSEKKEYSCVLIFIHFYLFIAF